MLKKLRVRITLLAAVLTGIVLAGVLTFSFWVTREQYRLSQRSTFDAAVEQLQYQWSQFDIFEDSWLADLERQSGIRIFLEENGQPLLYSTRSSAELSQLSRTAREIARNEHQLDCSHTPIAGLSRQDADFQFEQNGILYRCAIRLSAAQNDHWTMAMVFQDLTPEQTYIHKLGLLFAAVAAAGLMILLVACWLVAGRAIRPIRESMDKQQEFLSAAGHELRTPLAVIRANVGAAEQQPKNTERYLSVIDSESARMGALVDELLLLSAGASARMRLTLASLAPDTFLLDFLESMEPLAAQKNRRLSIELSDDALPNIQADAYRLRQLLTILLDNAFRFSPEQGLVTLRLSAGKGRVCFWVIDHGPGVPDPYKKKIFQRFVQTAPASPGDRQHYGLGLAVAQELTQLHNGQIWVQDTPDGGATFCVELKSSSS